MSRRPRSLIILLVPFCLIVLRAPAFADGATRLTVCNKGEMPVAVAVARSEGFLDATDYWFISGVTIAPQNCAVVYDKSGQGASGKSA